MDGMTRLENGGPGRLGWMGVKSFLDLNEYEIHWSLP